MILPMSVDHDVEIRIADRFPTKHVSEASRSRTEVHRAIDTMPGDVFAPEGSSANRRVRLAKRDHQFKKAEDLPVLLKPVPIEPRDFVVLIVRIIIPALRIQKFVTSDNHRN